MSRLIKDFGYVEKFQDTIQCFAEDINQMNMNGLLIRISKDYHEQDIMITVHAFAPEERTGYITLETTWPSDLNVKLEIDEDKFVETVFNMCLQDESTVDMWNNPTMIQWYYDLNRKVCERFMSQGYWVQFSDSSWSNDISQYDQAVKLKLSVLKER